MKHSSKILLYQTANGETKIDVRLEDETVWLINSTKITLRYCFK